MSDLAGDIERLAHDLTAAHLGTEIDNVGLWAQIRELGVDRIGIDEALGGSGGSTGDLVTAVAAFSREGSSLPLVENAAAMLALTGAGVLDDGWATIAAADDGVVLSGERISGTVRDVPWLGQADTVVIHLADSGLVSVTPGVAGARLTQLTNSVAGEPLATLVLDDAEAHAIDADTDAVRTRWRLLDVVALLGSAHGAYELTKDYVNKREQFGKPLIAIPSVATNLAQMSVNLLLADAAVRRALEGDHPQHRATLDAARVIGAEAGTMVARIAHQLHGAMGITREYPLHRFTTSVWARRDRIVSQPAAAHSLGVLAMRGGDAVLWDVLTF